MNHIRITSLALGLGLLTGCSPTEPAEPIDRSETAEDSDPPESFRLRWNFNDGDRFRWTYRSGMEMEGPQGDQLVNGSMTARMVFDVEVQALDDGRFRMLYDLDQLRITSNTPGTTFDYDSTQVDPDTEPEVDFDLPEEELTARLYESMFHEMLALRIETVADSSGRIHDLNVVGELEPLAQQQGLESLLFLIDPDGLDSLHAGGFVRFPEEDITAGDTWEDSTEIAVRYGTLRFTHTATCTGPEVVDGAEVLRFDTSVSSTSVANPGFEDLIEMQDDGGSGMLHVDHQAGQLVSCRFLSDQTMRMLGSNFGGEDFEGTITYSSESTIERLGESSPEPAN